MKWPPGNPARFREQLAMPFENGSLLKVIAEAFRVGERAAFECTREAIHRGFGDSLRTQVSRE